MTESPPPPLRDKVFSSALWLVATRWTHRLLGLISTMVLARVLMPEDFGIVAAVTAVIAIMDGFFEFGFDLALIREKDATREDFDTAWTMRLLKGALFGLLIVVVSPLVARIAHADEIIAISLLMGAGITIRGAENVGIVALQKELNFDRLFLIKLYPRLLGVTTTIALAITLRSYWAIVLGGVGQLCFQVLFSYTMCDFRPRLRLQGMSKLWHFSKWILVSAISRQLFSAMDRFVLSGLVSKRALGYYSVSSELSSMITNELIGAVGSALIPGYAKLQNECARLRAAFLTSQSAFVALLVPASIGVWLLSSQLTAVVLGSQWGDAAELLGWFSVFFLLYSIVENLNRFMAMTGLQEKAAYSGVVRTVSFLILVYPAFQFGGVPSLVGMKICLSGFETLYLASHCCRRVEAPILDYLRIYVRPIAATVCMALTIAPLAAALELAPIAELLLCALSGALVYAAVSLLLWAVLGRPNGLEAIVIDVLSRKGLLASVNRGPR